MNFARWLFTQQWRADRVGDLARALCEGIRMPRNIAWGPSDINEAQGLVLWLLESRGSNVREVALLWGSAMYRAFYEFRLHLTGQQAHTDDQRAAVSR